MTAPNIDKHEPTRTKLLRDREEPICATLTIDIAELSRAKLRRDKEEPRWRKPTVEKV